uniref:Uncharacterized protein n=1 Tax=Salix viminalis TaxID=40686 RepID=A0A6N2NIS7_SALVM
MTLEDSLRTLSLDYLNLLINGQAFSDVTFSVEGRFVHAHRCILAARSLFFRKYFCGPDPPSGLDPSGSRINPVGSPGSRSNVIPVNAVGYEVFLLLLQFLYSGQVSIVPPKHEPRPNCGERGCWHTHCTSAVDLALDTLAAARYFGVEQLAMLTQKQLASMVVKASIEDVMKPRSGQSLLELGAADVNYPQARRENPLHIAAEMVSPDMFQYFLTIMLTLMLCLELVQSAALVLSREEGSVNATTTNPIYPPRSDEHNTSSSGTNLVSLNLDSRLVYLNLGAAGSGQMGSRMEGDNDSSQSSQRDHHAMISRHVPTMYHHHSHDY